jgi:hypothetical protein
MEPPKTHIPEKPSEIMVYNIKKYKNNRDSREYSAAPYAVLSFS